MKLFVVGVILATVSFQATNALNCMQGIEVRKGENNEAQKSDKPLDITECGITSVAASTVLLGAVKPSSLTLPSTEYKCYHLKYEEKNSDTSTIIKGCIYTSLNVCDGKFSSSNVKESFCSQCEMDGCNSGGRFAFDFKLLGLTLAAFVVYLLK